MILVGGELKYRYMVSSKELGIEFNASGGKKILARLATILAILLFLSARGPKINNIQKKSLMKNTIFYIFFLMVNIFQILKYQISFKILKELVIRWQVIQLTSRKRFD